MFITKQILNEKVKRLMLPHTRQILSEIKASIDDQNWNIDRYSMITRPKSCKNRLLRPKTANSKTSNLQISNELSTHQRPESAIKKNRASTQQKENRSSIFIKKINSQFNQIKEITSLFDNFFDLTKKKNKDQNKRIKYKNSLCHNKNIFSQKVQIIKKNIRQKQKEHKLNFQKTKRVTCDKTTQNEPNVYMGYPKQKVNKIIPSSMAKDSDINMITRCVKGGYVDECDEFSQKVNKSQLIKLKKRFITLNTLYDSVKGNKNKGIKNIKPQNVDRNSFQNYVYYLENQKNLKINDKIAIQQKINIIIT